MRQAKSLVVVVAVAAMMCGCVGEPKVGFLTGSNYPVISARATDAFAFNVAIGGGFIVGSMDISVTAIGDNGNECVLNFSEADFIGAQIGPIISLGVISMVGEFEFLEVDGGVHDVEALRGTYIGPEAAITPIVGGNFVLLSNGDWAIPSEWLFTIGLEAGFAWDWIDIVFYVESFDGDADLPSELAKDCLEGFSGDPPPNNDIDDNSFDPIDFL